ncbi:MAG: MFS transporter [Planctomycetota bacterium]
MRYLVLVGAIVIQICLGGLYAWSVFVEPLKRDHSLSVAQTQLIFGCLIATFTISMVFAGKLLPRLGPRLLAVLSGALFTAGYLVAAASGGAFPLLFLGIAVLSGIATGFGYVVPLTTCMRWFPHHRGLITGIAMAGFGGGAVLLSNVAKVLLGGGLDVLQLFGWVGLVYGGAILLAALAMRAPAPTPDPRSAPATAIVVLLKEPFFIALCVGMFCGTFAGLLVIGNLKPLLLSYGVSETAATLSISAFAVGNFAGRITWGWAADRYDTGIIPVTLGALAAALALLHFAAHTQAGATGIALAIGFGFGACFVIYAAQVARRYGADRVGSTYPFVFLAYGVAGIAGPPLGGWLYDSSGGYAMAIGVSIALVLAGGIGTAALLYGPAGQRCLARG